MITFEIDESLKFRGGNHYCDVYANDANEVVEALKDAWFSSGIHRYGGELFLSARLRDSNGKYASFSIGNCTLDKKENLYGTFEFPYDSTEKRKWYSHGLFLDYLEGDEIENVIDAFFDYDCPDRVLGSYLYKTEVIFNALSTKEKKSFGENILANILDFSIAHNKRDQMLAWLTSDQGTRFLTENDQFVIAGGSVEEALNELKNQDLEQFISTNKKDFGFSLFLPSSNL